MRINTLNADTAIQRDDAQGLKELRSCDTVITSRRGLFELNIQELWSYRDLLYLFVRRDIVTVYQQTILGPLWFLTQPIATTITYTVVFTNIAHLETDGAPAPLFYLSGVVAWSYFQDCLLKTSNTFSGNSGLFGKVYFPRLIVPLSQVLSGMVKLGIQLSLFALVYVWYIAADRAHTPSYYMLLSIPCIGLLSILSLGLGAIFTSMTTKYRDLGLLLQFGIQLLMYGTPIIYPTSALPLKTREILWWNPLTHIIDWFRYSTLSVGEPSSLGFLYAIVFSTISLGVGTVVFNRTEATFADTV